MEYRSALRLRSISACQTKDLPCQTSKYKQRHVNIGMPLFAGVASDAMKVAEYRSALRVRSAMLAAGSWSAPGDEAAYKNFSRILAKACASLTFHRYCCFCVRHACCFFLERSAVLLKYLMAFLGYKTC